MEPGSRIAWRQGMFHTKENSMIRIIPTMLAFLGIQIMTGVPELLAEDRVEFERDVRPILEQHCYECHSGTEQESGLRLDVKQLAFKGGDNYGPDIVPGKAHESPLIRFIAADEDDDLLMPPGEKLSDAEIETLRRWINEGAVWPDGVDRVQLADKRDHWSFKPLAVSSVEHSIDDFIAAKLDEHGLKMTTEAEPLTWLRRVTLDLTGLPPNPEEVRDFLQRLASEAGGSGRLRVYADVVDRLLASDRYGERWAQYWLDVVRYADTHGFEVNTERPHAWPYRDYVIRAFNSDTPYDRFIKEQIVGDAIGQDAATGFLITASVLLPGQIGMDEPSKRLARQDSIDEIVNNISQTFLGLGVGCARCHDHKFDPITAKDYYAMQAFVAGVEYADREIGGPEAEAQKRAAEPMRKQWREIDDRLAQMMSAVEAGSPARPTNAQENIESFQPLEAKFVRFSIHDSNLHPSLGLIEPCIDEFEIYTDGPEPRNVALASCGTKVTASGSRTSEAHKLEHINDGQFGNTHSWMSDTNGRGWVQFELAEPTRISKVVWSRDRKGEFQDRLPTAYTLEAGLASDSLNTIGGVTTALRQLFDEKAELEARIKVMESLPLVFAGTFREPDPIHLLLRGDPEQPQQKVLPAVLSALGDISLDEETTEQDRRRALADWIASSRNPLTARVMVNRIWQGHFGTGLVSTPSDLGNNGARPTHPELLDWLAAEFIRAKWSIKHMHRLIVLSKTYRQGSASGPESSIRIDAGSRWLWRYPSRRLDAECIRDSMLAVSGCLNLKMYGSGFDLFEQRGGLSGFQPVETLSSENQRRMIYAHKVRREMEAVFGAFDCPDAGQSTAVRRASTTPIQALNLFNSRFTLDVSAAFADRIKTEVGDDIPKQIDRAYQRALNRFPTPAERDDAEPIVREYGLQVLCRVLFNSNEFLFIP